MSGKICGKYEFTSVEIIALEGGLRDRAYSLGQQKGLQLKGLTTALLEEDTDRVKGLNELIHHTTRSYEACITAMVKLQSEFGSNPILIESQLSDHFQNGVRSVNPNA